MKCLTTQKLLKHSSWSTIYNLGIDGNAWNALNDLNRTVSSIEKLIRILAATNLVKFNNLYNHEEHDLCEGENPMACDEELREMINKLGGYNNWG